MGHLSKCHNTAAQWFPFPSGGVVDVVAGGGSYLALKYTLWVAISMAGWLLEDKKANHAAGSIFFLICGVFLFSFFSICYQFAHVTVTLHGFLLFVFLKLAKCWRSVDWSMVLGMLMGFPLFLLFSIVAWILCVLGCDRLPGFSQPLAWPNKLAGIYCSTLLVGIDISLCLRWLGMEGDFPVPGISQLPECNRNCVWIFWEHFTVYTLSDLFVQYTWIR